jgi:hypothetical protein
LRGPGKPGPIGTVRVTASQNERLVLFVGDLEAVDEVIVQLSLGTQRRVGGHELVRASRNVDHIVRDLLGGEQSQMEFDGWGTSRHPLDACQGAGGDALHRCMAIYLDVHRIVSARHP